VYGLLQIVFSCTVAPGSTCASSAGLSMLLPNLPVLLELIVVAPESTTSAGGTVMFLSGYIYMCYSCWCDGGRCSINVVLSFLDVLILINKCCLVFFLIWAFHQSLLYLPPTYEKSLSVSQCFSLERDGDMT
jgi:hypothetical protein